MGIPGVMAEDDLRWLHQKPRNGLGEANLVGLLCCVRWCRAGRWGGFGSALLNNLPGLYRKIYRDSLQGQEGSCQRPV